MYEYLVVFKAQTGALYNLQVEAEDAEVSTVLKAIKPHTEIGKIMYDCTLSSITLTKCPEE